ncbi:MAG: cell wall hydrolase [Lachnospiraceae bacterium]|nr:cell wall hydrolase [Lachnospiraceae bacterium]
MQMIKRLIHPNSAKALILAIIIVLAGILSPGFLGFYSNASSKTESTDTANETEESISELQEQQKETKEKLSDAKDKRDDKADEISELNEEGRELSIKMGELNTKIAAIDEKISKANAEISEAEANIDNLEEEMALLQDEQDRRYEIMKKHLVFFYENKDQLDVVSMFYKSGSFSEFLNRTEVLSAIVEYDNNLIRESEKAHDKLMEESAALELQQERLSSRRKDLKSSQKEMDKLFDEVQKEAKKNAMDAKKAEKEKAKLDAQITGYKADLEAYQAAEAEAQAELARQLAEAMAAMEAEQGGREDTTGAYAASASDVTLLAATIEAEAGNQSYFGQQAVASVIMNRVKSSLFPNTIFGVISQENQFQPYRQGIVDAFIQRGPNEQCIQIAQAAIDGERVGDWLFFMTVPSADSFGITGYEVIGDHAFFYKWGDN